MTTCNLKEDKRLPKLPIVPSPEISQEIDDICKRNYDSQEHLSEWLNHLEGIFGYISDPVIAWDNTDRYNKLNGETYIAEGDIDVGFIIKIENATNKPFIYIFYMNLLCDNYGLKESNTKRSVVITESTLKSVIRKYVKEALWDYIEKVGKHRVIDGDGLEHTADSLKHFGTYNHIRMYDSAEDTYCLMQRCKNGMYFFTKIIDAPELGKNETKFIPVKPKDVPPIILRDAKSLIRSRAIVHNILC